MDSSRFDQWTRIAARGKTRRSLLRALTALATAAFVKSSDAVAGTRCYGYGCPCINDRSCTDGLVCCGGICMSAGDCGVSCRGDGAACPHQCELGGPCSSCCGGFFAAFGGWPTPYYAPGGEGVGGA